jgi:antitoxin YefM
MLKPLLNQDVRPLSEFRANATGFIEQVRESKRPLLITQHGRGAAVLIDVDEYEYLLEKLELLQDVQKAEEQIAAGKVVPHETARKRILKNLKK